MHLIILKSMTEYKAGYELKDDEYLLKIRPADQYRSKGKKTGFLTKLTQKKAIPKVFAEWNGNWDSKCNLTTWVFKEEFRSGWKLHDWRFGKSQNWASLVHPKGFTVEIYLTQLLEIMKSHTVIKGEIQGEFKWQDNKLICKAHTV